MQSIVMTYSDMKLLLEIKRLTAHKKAENECNFTYDPIRCEGHCTDPPGCLSSIIQSISNRMC